MLGGAILVATETIWYAFFLCGREPAAADNAGVQDAALLIHPTEDSRFRGAFYLAPGKRAVMDNRDILSTARCSWLAA